MRIHSILLLITFAATTNARADIPRPNILLILCDDLGYGDLACYGNTKIQTPHLDRLAARGVRFTSFYAAGAQCTPSRAGLLTGRYPARFGLTYTLMTNAGAGIPAAETLLPELLQTAGYTTLLAGKWHLGDRPEYHPRRHGFDHFLGLLRGHDTDPRELWRDDTIIDRAPDPTTLTQRFTDAATAFITDRGRDRRPFFLLLAHTAPHTPLHPPAPFKGKSAAGPYGDVVGEIDHSVGQLVDALHRAKLDDNTLILFTSDNGPETGSRGPLRGGKFSTFEGGIRVPAIAAWPNRIKPRVEPQPAILLDLFSTIATLAGAKPPADRPIDGRDLSKVLLDAANRDGDEFFFYFRDQLQACRIGRWKLKLEDNRPLLFDLNVDLGEKKDLALEQADVANRIRDRMSEFDQAVKAP